MTGPSELESLRTRVKLLEAQIRSLGHEPVGLPSDYSADSPVGKQRGLGLDEYIRYGRQMILPGFGLPSQLTLRDSSILVLGAGGLGCPALMYLAAAGVGKITIVDHDLVEVSNLHRQVLHGVDMVGKPKVESARQALLRINPSIDIITHCMSLTLATLPAVFTRGAHFHAVLDCTDTPSTRYLLSDVTARLGIPLISGAAQRTDGQLVVYNLPPSNHVDATNPDKSGSSDTKDQTSNATDLLHSAGPCMRCIFPSVPRTGAGAERCSDVGVLGPVVGVIGVLMALETIKILTGFGVDECQLQNPSMLLFTSLSPRPFRNIKLRPRQPKCPGCSIYPQRNLPQRIPISELMADATLLEDSYNQFCGIEGLRVHNDPILTGAWEGEPGTRVKALVLKEALASAAVNSTSVEIIDTRPPTEFGICSIPGSVNVPLSLLLKTPEEYVRTSMPIYVVCRLGNDSQVAVRALRSAIQAKGDGSQTDLDGRSGNSPSATHHRIVDVIGGLRAWAREVDQSFPVY